VRSGSATSAPLAALPTGLPGRPRGSGPFGATCADGFNSIVSPISAGSKALVGIESPLDLTEFPSDITSRLVVVSRRGALGKPVQALNLRKVHNVPAGSVTDPPAPAFACAQEPSSDGVSMALVAVYPLTMLLRALAAQALILFFG
jgi:uncharacterized transporter YbjL